MEWLYGIIAAVVLGLLGLVWKNFKDEIASIRHECDERDKRVWDQIGRDSHSGMRRTVHAMDSLPKQFMELDHDVEDLKRRVSILDRPVR